MNLCRRQYSSTLFILPTALMVEERLKTFVKDGSVLAGYRIMTFPELINTLAKDFPPQKRQISSIGELILIKDAVFSASKETDPAYLSSVLDSPVFFRAVHKFVKELRQALVSSSDFEKAIKHSSNKRYRCLAGIYSNYENRLKSLNLTDALGRQMEVLARLEGSKEIPQFLSGAKSMIIEGFYDLLPIHKRLVNALIVQGIKPDIVPIYSIENPDVTRASEEMLNFFETMETLSPDSIIFKPSISSEEKNNINLVIENLFKTDNACPEPCLNLSPKPAPACNKQGVLIGEPAGTSIIDSTVRLISAPGRYAEIEAVGREIRKLLKEGSPLSDIAVVFRDITAYEDIVADVFRRFNIPLYFRQGRSLLAVPVIKNILSIYSVIESNFEREQVLKLLNSSYLDISKFSSAVDFKDIERVVSEIKVIDDSTPGWAKAFERYLKSLGNGVDAPCSNRRIDRENVIRAKNIVLNFIDMLKGAGKKQTFLRHKESLYTIIKRLCIEERCAFQQDTYSMQALEILRDAITEIENTLKSLGKDRAVIPAAGFLELILEGLGEKKLPAYKNKGGVKALSILDARGIRFQYLFVCGLNDGEFPLSETQHVFIRDDDKRILNKAMGRRVFLTNKAGWWKEPLLFVLAVSQAEKRLYLTCSYLDETGRDILPSIFFREVLRILQTEKNPKHFKKIHLSEVIVNTDDALEKEELSAAIMKALHSSYDDAKYALNVLELTGDEFKNNILRQKDICKIERLRSNKLVPEGVNQGEDASPVRNQHTGSDKPAKIASEFDEGASNGASEWTGGVADTWLKKKLKEEFLSEESVWSAAMLETLARCPFAFYMKEVLKLVEPRETDIEIDRLTTGSIIHKILERFYKTAKETGLVPFCGKEAGSSLLDETIAGTFKEIETAGWTGGLGLWKIKKLEITDMLERFYNDAKENLDKDFTPEYFEIEFGMDKDIPPLALPLSDGATLHIRGRIDRIDKHVPAGSQIKTPCLLHAGAGFGDKFKRGGERGLRVIDYKFKTLPSRDDIGKTHFQLLLYILAAGKHFNPVCTGLYYSIKDHEISDVKSVKGDNGFIPLGEYLSDRNGETRTLTKDIDRLISFVRTGVFKIEPCNDRVCIYCEFKNICRHQ